MVLQQVSAKHEGREVRLRLVDVTGELPVAGLPAGAGVAQTYQLAFPAVATSGKFSGFLLPVLVIDGRTENGWPSKAPV